MTEAPFATDYLTQLVCERLGNDHIASRPCDIWLQTEKAIS